MVQIGNKGLMNMVVNLVKGVLVWVNKFVLKVVKLVK